MAQEKRTFPFERARASARSMNSSRRLAARGYDPTYGARPLKRLIQKTIADSLAQQILAGKLSSGDRAEITLDGEEDFEIRRAA